MATTSIWHVKGNLRQVIDYARNEDKTSSASFDESATLAGADAQGLTDVMAYVTNPTKTEQRLFVTGINCDPASARDEMNAVKRGYNKEGGIVAWHGYQSFKPGEVTPEVAHTVGVRLAERLWGDDFQVIVATHLDKGHLHNHLVLNSVSCADGHRYHRTAKDYHDLRAASDELCREHGLSVIESPAPGKTKHYSEWQAEREGKPTWKSVIKSDVDECIFRAKTERDFFSNLEALGYEYKRGRDISVRPPGKERFFRLARKLGDDYTIEAIRARIQPQSKSHGVLPVPRYRHPAFTPPKKLTKAKRHSITALYHHYLYLMGYYERYGNPHTNARMHYLLREDIRKLDEYTADARLLGREGIESAGQLRTFHERRKHEIDTLINERKELKARIRADAGEGNSYTTKDNPRYQQINQRLRKLRKEVTQCIRIEERSHTLTERIARIEQDEDKKLHPTRRQRKERQPHGRNGTGNRPDAEDRAYRH
jgi:hypothetical protein